MRVSSLSTRFGFVLVLIAGAVGCAQSGTGVSVTAPSVESGARAVSASPSSMIAQLGPGASYDASGSWHVVVRSKPNGTIMDEGDVAFVQDAEGNVQVLDGPTLTRLGTGDTIAYFASDVEHHTNCDTDLSGLAQIHTRDNTFNAHLSGIEAELNCSQVEFWVTGTKN